MKNFTKLLLLICVAFLPSQTSKAQSIVASYNCTGAGSATLSVSPTTGITAYSWRNASNAVVATTPTINQPSGAFTVIITRVSGTTTLGPFTIASNIVPTVPSVTPATVANAICGTATQTLTSSTAANYVWLRDGVAISGATASTLSISGNSVTTPSTNNYRVSVLNPVTACSAISNQVSLSISPKPATPVISPVSSSLLCGNNTTTLTATGGGTTYTWKRGATVLGSTVNTYTATGTEAAAGNYNYTVSYVNSVGCQSDESAPVALTLSSKPATPVISPATLTTPICGTATQVLTVASGATSYAWKRAGVGIAGSTNSITVTGNDVATPGTYAYSVSSVNAVGCPSDESAVVNLKVSPKPATPIITPASFTPNVICGTDTRTLTATSGGSKYNWFRNGTLVTSSTSSNLLTIAGADVTTGGTYSYTVSLENSVGCVSDVSSTAVTLQLFPAASLPSSPTISQTGGVFLTGSAIGACEGTTVELTSSYVSGSNVWSLASGSDVVTTGTNGIVVNGVGSYVYTVKARDSNGCLSPASNAVQVVVYVKPATPTITTPTTLTQICGSEVKTLTASLGGSSYTWIRSNNNVNTTLNSPTTNTYDVTGSSITTGGTYSFTVASNQSYSATRNGTSVTCTSNISQPVTIILFPSMPQTPTVTANGNTILCEGNSVTLNSSYTVGTNVWSRLSRADTTTNTTTGLIVNTVGTNSITVKAKDSNGCTSTSSSPFIVTVNPRPAIPVLNNPGNIQICDLDSTTLRAVNNYSGGSYQWKRDNINLSSNTSINLKTGGAYTLIYTDGVNRCPSLSSIPTVLTVNPLPVKPTLSTFGSRPLEFCYKNEAGNFNFATIEAVSSTSNTTFQWDNGRVSRLLDTTVINRSTKTETISITAKSISDRGCKSKDKSDPITITVNPLPTTPDITASRALTFCPDSTITLTSTVSPTGAYKWINAKDNSEFSTNRTVVIDTTSKFFSNIAIEKVGRFYVRTVSDKSCVSDTSRNIIIRVRNAPQPASIEANPRSATVCSGGKVTLKALFSDGNITRYSWRDESTLQEVSTQQEVSVIESGNYSVRLRDVFGCFAATSKPIKVSISPLPNKPTLSLVKPKVFCEEDSVVVQASLASTTPNGNRTLYSWIVDGQTVLETFSRTFSYKRVGVISVALTDSNGCKAAAVSDTIRTTVNPLPNSPTITVRGANPFCADKNVALNAVGASGVTYKWSTGATTQTITTNTAGNVTVQAINGFGCLSKPSQSVLIRVYDLPQAPRITANGDVTFCEGSRVRIVSSSPFEAVWYRNTVDSVIKSEDNSSVFANKSGNYFAKVKQVNNLSEPDNPNSTCFSAASSTITVDSKPNPTPTIIKQIGSFTLDAQGLGDENGYLWRYNGNLEKELTTRLIKASKGNGDYQVQASITYTGITNIAGGRLVCFSKVSDILKYEQDVSFEGFSVFPNPSQDGVINVEVLDDLIGTEIMIYDLYGRVVANYMVDKFNTLKRVELPKLHGTTYIVKISSGGFERTRKVLIF
jgi:hypothetical protein